jgi:para-nitrobenzyl esterase
VKKQILACLVTLAAVGGSWAQAQIMTAKVTGGTVQGVAADNIVSFKGIPFAAPPTGELPGDQYDLYRQNRFNDTPVLIGTNSDEGQLFARPGVTAVSFGAEVREGFGDKASVILAAYPSSDDAEAATSSKNLFRDSTFAWPTWTWARLQSGISKNSVYVYYFDHRTPGTPDGATHGAEIPFVFGNPDTRLGPPSAADLALAERISTYWVNFAKTSDPNGPGLPTWPAFNESAQQVLSIDGTTAAKPVPNVPQLQALNDYYAWRRAEVQKKN